MPELPSADAFDWVRYPWGPALRCQPLAAVAEHCFTTRRPDIPPEAAAAQVGPTGDGWQILALAFRLPVSRLVRLRQIHGSRVITVAAPGPPRGTDDQPSGAADPPPGGVDQWPDADASVTCSGEVALVVKVADCVPLLLADRRSGAVAAVHAGWRGAMAGVVAAAVRELKSAFSVNPADLVAAVGPSIGPCCYRVGTELRDQFLEAGQPVTDVGRWFVSSPPLVARHGVPGSEPVSTDGRAPLWLDMWSVVADQLATAGLAADNVLVARLCTSCHREIFHSYRADGPAAGRMVGVIRVRAS